MKLRCLGVFREAANSPNRENDDALILKAVTEELSGLGMETHLIEPANIDLIKPNQWDAVIPMCENPSNISKLLKWTHPLFINPVDSVTNCYRDKMTDLIKTSVPRVYPLTEKRDINDIPGPPPSFLNGKGCWLKRGDVHNTCSHDVQFVKNWADSKEVKKDFKTRAIKSVIVQENIPGDLIKFYGVGPYKWFDWFYHRPQEISKFAFNLKDLEKAAGAVAKAVNLEIYGGDAIITPESQMYIIDINSWPSFARVRETAKTHISKYIHSKIKSRRKK